MWYYKFFYTNPKAVGDFHIQYGLHHVRLKQETFISLLQVSDPAKAASHLHILELTF